MNAPVPERRITMKRITSIFLTLVLFISFVLPMTAFAADEGWYEVCSTSPNGYCYLYSNASDRYGQLAVQGPKATEMLQLLTDADLSAIPYYAFREWSFAGVQGVILSNTGYTGAGGFELYFPKEHSQQIWDALFEVGKPFGLAPIGLGARDSLRVEKWYCLYGHDIDDTTSPLEAGLGWITKFDAKDFIDKEYLLKQKAEGVQRKLVHFECLERAIPRCGYEICDEKGEVIGNVTSGIMLPTTKVGIGMGYVKTAFAKKETIIYVKIREKLIPAKIV